MITNEKSKGLHQIGCIFIIFIAILAFGFERLFWVNANSYPEIFATSHINKLSEDEYLDMRESCGQPLEVRIYPSYIAIRCGLYWPFNQVVLVDAKGMPWFGKK